MAKRRKMSDATLVAIVEARANDAGSASGTGAGALNAFRKQALQYYRGDPFGTEQEGRSKVVSRDVQETIDSMMPSIMKVFSSGDEVVAFEPHGPEDEEGAKQATEYCNWVWQTQNPGFRVFYWWFKDALMYRQGVIKIWWDKTPKVTTEVYRGLTPEQAKMLQSDADLEIKEESEPYLDLAAPPQIDPATGQPGPPPLLVDITVAKTNKQGRIRIANVPLEEFLLARRAIDIESAPLTGQRSKKTISELIAMGYDQKLLDSLPSEDIFDLDTEKVDRFKDDDEVGTGASESGVQDPSMRYVWVTEVYMTVDYDGDGIAEMRHICVAGGKILDNEEVDDNPYAMCVPILMQHKAIGQSVTDQTMDIQLIKSTLQRQFLDNLYLQNSPVMAVDDNQIVDIDELLTRRVGGVVRTKGPPGNAFMPVPAQFVGAEVLQAIEYLDTTKEQRSGVTRYNQGLDPNSLNKTATGINIISNASAARIELVTRCFAEGGVKTAFQKILKLSAENNTKPQMIRLRGKWVPVDPRAWKNGFDAVATVGLGTGSKDQQLAHLMSKMNIDAQIIKLQGGLNGPILKAEGVYNTLKKFVENMGFKSVEQFYADPTPKPGDPPPQPPPPSPEQQKMMADEQRAQQEHGRTMEMKGVDLQSKNIDLEIARLNAQVKAGELLQPTTPVMPDQVDPIEQEGKQLDIEAKRVAVTKAQREVESLGSQTQERASATDAIAMAGQQSQAIMQALQQIVQMVAQSQERQAQMEQTMIRALTAPKTVKRLSDGSMRAEVDASSMVN